MEIGQLSQYGLQGSRFLSLSVLVKKTLLGAGSKQFSRQ